MVRCCANARANPRRSSTFTDFFAARVTSGVPASISLTERSRSRPGHRTPRPPAISSQRQRVAGDAKRSVGYSQSASPSARPSRRSTRSSGSPPTRVTRASTTRATDASRPTEMLVPSVTQLLVTLSHNGLYSGSLTGNEALRKDLPDRLKPTLPSRIRVARPASDMDVRRLVPLVRVKEDRGQ